MFDLVINMLIGFITGFTVTTVFIMLSVWIFDKFFKFLKKEEK
jgi:type III secretory pathway component EscV